MAEGVRYFVQASNVAMASIPSRSISSRLIISSHPPHETSRPSSRPMRLANHLERYTRGINERMVMAKQANEHEKPDGETGRGTGEQDGARTERTQQDNGERDGARTDGKQASREKATRACDAITHKNDAPHHSRPTPSPVFSSACWPQSIPRPRGVG